jgi:hypothetical protein
MPHARLFGAIIALTSCTSHSESTLRAALPDTAPMVKFTVDLWPGEGIPVIEMRRAMLPLREAPDPASPVVDTLRGRTGKRLAYDSTRVQTLEAGSFRVHTPLTLTGRDLGDISYVSLDRYYASLPDVTMDIAATDTITYLQYRAEGTCFVRMARRVIDANPCPGFGKESVAVLREPVTRWWIRVQGEAGVWGWLVVSDSTAQAVRREF